MKFCSQAFYNAEIYENGDVYNCCPHFQDYTPIGNIFQNSFKEIWNSKREQEIRKGLLNSDFSMCNSMCDKYNCEQTIEKDCKIKMKNYPLYIAISADNICNVKCRFCRDNNKKSDISDKEYISMIDEKILPIFKDAKTVRFGCSGEPFASRKEKELIKRITQKYTDCKIQIFTNGLLGNANILKKYELTDKIDFLTVSIHAATKETYEKIVRGGNYEKLNKNLKMYSKMKKSGKLYSLDFVFVVYSENYTEIPDFIKFAKKYNARPLFWAFRQNSLVEIGKKYKEYSIIEPKNKHHKKLVKILNSTDFSNAYLAPELEKLIIK